METQTPPVFKKDPVTDNQAFKWHSQLDDLLRKHGGNQRRAQRILGHPDFIPGIIRLMNECGIDNEFANERVDADTNYGYDIRTLPGTDEQIAKQIAAMGLKGAVEVLRCDIQPTLHPEADGFAAIPSLSDLGAIWGINDPLGDGYGLLLEKLLGYVKQQRGEKFHNYRNGQLTKDHIRLFWILRRTWEAIEALTLAEEGKVRFFIVPTNFGKKYQGFSPRNARMDALDIDAMPIDPASATAILLGWPDWQSKQENMVTDCPGAEYSWNADGRWAGSCYFRFAGSRLRFYAGDAGRPYGRSGTVVVFPGVLLFGD